ncbi:hypothetical protein SDC9_166876 [bioreactor metagenome]|uniref:Uncharacterized protein n=1 Tax=bioreactor metagenome TaxID=1076179 RepID=A0A645FYK3_9ZZZZ
MVPVKAGPFQSPAAALAGNLRKPDENRLAVPLAAMLRQHKQVLQIDARLAQKRGKVMEVQRKPNFFPVFENKECLRRPFDKQPVVQRLLRRNNEIEHMLIFRQRADKRQ